MESEQQPQQRSSTLNVCLRIKPLRHQTEQNTYTVDSERSLRVKTWKGNEIYKFSHIFNQESSQEDVFVETAAPAVKLFLEGQDCLLFAYGTTNAGKTFSVQGTSSNPGIVPRAINNIFSSIQDKIDKCPRIAPVNYGSAQLRAHKDKIKVEKIKSMILHQSSNVARVSALPSHLPLVNCSLSFSSALSSTISAEFDSGVGSPESHDTSTIEELGWNQACRCSLWVSMVEVYNENIIDLLGSTKTNSKVGVSTDPDGRFYLQGQTEINVSTLEEAKCVIQYGNKQRKNSSTLLNISSSRSHCILRLRLLRADRVMADMMQVGPQSPAAVDIDDFHVSTFMFCDLAGSERVNKAGNKGQQAKESCNINNSLVVLGRCLETLRLKGGTMQYGRNAIVPYRDSKLTMILQPLLSEPGPKSLLVNINTSNDLVDETLNVLKFSSVARVIVVKEPVKTMPHYQMPTHIKQLLELKAAMELEDSLARETRVSEEPVLSEAATAEIEVQTSFKIEVQTETVDTEEQATQTEVVAEKTDSPEIADLKQMVKLYQQKEEKWTEELQSKISEVKQDLFKNFEDLEQKMHADNEEQLNNKEAQLYNLMTDRLNIQETFYKDLLSQAEQEVERLQNQLKVAEKTLKETTGAQKVTNESFKEVEDLKQAMEQREKDFLDKSKEQETENNGLLYAYGEKDKEVEALKIKLEKVLKEKDLALETKSNELEHIKQEGLKMEMKFNNLKLEMEVLNDMLRTASSNSQDMTKQNQILVADSCDKEYKLHGLQAECAALRDAETQNIIMIAELEKENIDLKQAQVETKSTLANLETENASLTGENSDLQKDIKSTKEHLKKALAETREFKEKAEKRTRTDHITWTEKLESAKEETQRYKKFFEYLMDQYRPDYRRSMAGCANEEAAWATLEKEVQAIPSRCAELEKQNHALKTQLDLKEQDLESFKKRRDAMLHQYERELQLKSQELDTCKRETQALNKQLLGMTPRKQDDTPKKSEFKTPLRASVNLKVPNSGSSATKSAAKHCMDDSDSVFVADSPLKSARKMRKRMATPSKEENVEPIAKKSSCRRQNAKPKLSPAKENLEPPPPPSPKAEKPSKSKPRTRRKLCSSSIHPALDEDQPPQDVELPSMDALQKTKRQLRSTYKY